MGSASRNTSQNRRKPSNLVHPVLSQRQLVSGLFPKKIQSADVSCFLFVTPDLDLSLLPFMKCLAAQNDGKCLAENC